MWVTKLAKFVSLIFSWKMYKSSARRARSSDWSVSCAFSECLSSSVTSPVSRVSYTQCIKRTRSSVCSCSWSASLFWLSAVLCTLQNGMKASGLSSTHSGSPWWPWPLWVTTSILWPCLAKSRVDFAHFWVYSFLPCPSPSWSTASLLTIRTDYGVMKWPLRRKKDCLSKNRQNHRTL